jgi:hypothetical protein
MLHELLAWRRDVREFRSDRVDAAIIEHAARRCGVSVRYDASATGDPSTARSP